MNPYMNECSVQMWVLQNKTDSIIIIIITIILNIIIIIVIIIIILFYNHLIITIQGLLNYTCIHI